MVTLLKRSANVLLFLSLLGWSGVCALAADGVRFMPGDSSLGSAHASQDAPEIAAGNNGFLAVWQDLRTSPFVGPPFSTEGRGFDIYAQLLDAGGAPVGRPFLITSKFGDQKLPQVAWNGQNWLVTWVGPNSTQWNQLIEGMRIAPDGTILDPDAIAIHNTMNQAKYSLTTNSLPAVGAEWLIAVQSNGAGENDIRAVRVSATGTVINPGGTQLRAATSSLYNFEIASAQGEYLLAWGNSSTGPFGNRYDADLNPIPGQFPLNSLNVSSNGSGYFLTWIINDTYWDDFVHGQQLSVDGVAGPVLTLAGTGGGLPLWNPAWSTVAWDGSNWWVSWADRNRGLVVTRVTTSNAVLDFGGLAVDPGAPADAALAHSLAGAPFNTGGGIQAVWEDSREGGRSSPDIYTGSVSGGALPGAGGSLSTATRTQFSTDFAVNGNEAMMVYISQHSGVREILARRLDQDGNALTAEPFLVARGPSIGNPRIGFDDTRYLVVWADESGVVGKRISTAGVVTDTVPLSIMPGGSPDVAGRDGVFLVVNTNATISAHFVDPFSLRIDGATGDALDAAPLSLGFYFARNPRVIAFGGGWLATWQRNISHDDINSSTFAAFVNADGTALPEFGYGGGGATPDAASAGDRALLVYRLRSPGSGHNDVYARLLFADGTMPGPSFAIAATPSPVREFDPEVTWNGTEFVVSWTDTRNSIIYYDKRSEVFGARVALDGTLIDPEGFSVGDTTDQETIPGITSLGGRTLLAMSGFRDEPDEQSYRITYQVLGNNPLGNRWPVAMAFGTPGTGDVPLSVAFTAVGSNDPDGSVASYSWDFGDGTSGTGSSPVHVFNSAGEYLAELTVTDNDGASTSNTVRINVTPVNQPPVAVAAADKTSGRAPLSVIYQAAGSYDPDDGIWQLYWEFGDGGTYYGGTAYHTYSAAGTWLTTLTVKDHQGGEATASIPITVGAPNIPPVAVVGADVLSGTSPLVVYFSSTDSYDSDGRVTGYLWNFGDGETSTQANPTHTYAVGGLFEAILTVSDNEGGSGTASVTIDVTQGNLFTHANADLPTADGVIASGSFWDTHSLDSSYEKLSEEQSKGKASKRRSLLSHTWAMDVEAQPIYKFHVNAYRSGNDEGDDFTFEYSRDGVNFAPMLVVSKTWSDNIFQSYTFGASVGGLLYIRVVDTDHSQGNSKIDSLFVDEMFVEWGGGVVDTTPPAIPTGLTPTPGNSTVSLDWVSNGETDLAGYHVYRGTVAGGPYGAITTSPELVSAYDDTSVSNGTTYYYVVTALDTSDNESLNSAEVSATPETGGGAATSMHVAGITVLTVNAGKGRKNARAQVSVMDDLGNAVAGAAVTGTFSGGINESGTASTGGSGTASITSEDTKKGGLSFTFCVTGVSAGLTYDSDSNVETCDSL